LAIPHARWWVARQSPLHPPYGKPHASSLTPQACSCSCLQPSRRHLTAISARATAPRATESPLVRAPFISTTPTPWGLRH
jgi:hypothetical protein